MIHTTLGGLLFTLNAIGYAVFAAGMVAPGPLAGVRWLVRLAMIGFTAATIAAWFAFGARFPLAYLDKSIEVGLLIVLGIEVSREDGGPVAVAKRVGRLGGQLTAAMGHVVALVLRAPR
jgi:hypothetical protein